MSEEGAKLPLRPKRPKRGGGEASPEELALGTLTGGALTPTVPPGAGHQVTYIFTDLFKFETIAELPVSSPTFSLPVNASGPFQATLATEDPGIRKAAWRAATAPWLTALWIDIDGVLIYGGPVTGRKHQQSTGILTVTGADFCTYLSQRVQALNYEAFIDGEGHEWAVEGKGAPVPAIAYYLLAAALEKEHSLPISVVRDETAVDERFWITFSAPINQQQTLLSMLTQLQQLGYEVGVDYACDVQWAAGVPTVAITLSYPRRGEALAYPPIIDLSPATDMEYSEDGTQMGNRVIEQTGATGGEPVSRESGNAMIDDGYPLLEKVVSHAALSPTPASEAVLGEYAASDLYTYTYPLVAPVIPLPMFGTPSIFDLTPVGNDVMLRIPTAKGDTPPDYPRFPDGLDYRFRCVRLDCSIPDEGLAMMTATLNIPPGNAEPPLPPG